MKNRSLVYEVGVFAVRLPKAVLYATISLIILSFVMTLAVGGVFLRTLTGDE